MNGDIHREVDCDNGNKDDITGNPAQDYSIPVGSKPEITETPLQLISSIFRIDKSEARQDDGDDSPDDICEVSKLIKTGLSNRCGGSQDIERGVNCD